jgi:hypothetical protein
MAGIQEIMFTEDQLHTAAAGAHRNAQPADIAGEDLGFGPFGRENWSGIVAMTCHKKERR